MKWIMEWIMSNNYTVMKWRNKKNGMTRMKIHTMRMSIYSIYTKKRTNKRSKQNIQTTMMNLMNMMKNQKMKKT